MPVKASSGAARLLRYGAESGGGGRTPVVLIPSLINPPTVLDLSERQSLLRYLAANGHDPWLVDWGTPAPDDARRDLASHVLDRLIPLLSILERPPVLAGYCLGGVLALGAATIIDTAAVATIATPWAFDGFPSDDRAHVRKLWTDAKPVCERLGYVPMEVLQSGFWALDPARTIHKYAAFGDMDADSDAAHAFLALEDWANAGPPLTFAAARSLFEDLYSDNLTGTGAWRISGKVVDPQSLSCPALSIRSARDRIVPAASSPPLSRQLTLDLGHVGMIVGSRARQALWEPLSAWLSSCGA